MNDHETGVIDAPAALVAPDATTEYVVAELNGADGVKVAVFVDALYAVDPATGVADGSETTIVAPVTAWSKPTATVVLTATFVAPGAGVCDVTTGARRGREVPRDGRHDPAAQRRRTRHRHGVGRARRERRARA